MTGRFELPGGFMRADELKFYLYQSKTKIDSLHRQIQETKKKTKVKWKLDWKFVSFERETETDPEINDEDRLQAVLSELEQQELVGAYEEGKPYVRGVFPMRWGIYNDSGLRPVAEGPLVYFSCVQDSLLLGLGGSSHHIIGCYGLTSTSSRSVTPALVGFLRSGLELGEIPHDYQREEEDDVYTAMALANEYLKGPVQSLEFVAKVLCRSAHRHCRLYPWDETQRGEAILATPLYVRQIDPMAEDG
jgi:hypothetical protein